VRLSEFALLVDAPPKWVLNTRALLGHSVRYTTAVALQLAVARVLNQGFEVPLPRAWTLAESALAARADEEGRVQLESGHGLATLSIDVFAIRAAIAARQSRLSTMHEPRRAGRRPKDAKDPLTHARQHGLDLGLLRSNLERRPAARLRQLDAMASFRSKVRRKRTAD
jgi:hypothetical protein